MFLVTVDLTYLSCSFQHSCEMNLAVIPNKHIGSKIFVISARIVLMDMFVDWKIVECVIDGVSLGLPINP